MQIMQRESLKKQHKRTLIKVILIVALVIIVGLMLIIFQSQRPMRQARERSIDTAKKVGVKNIESFYMSDLNRTFYTIGGKTSRGHQLYVIMNKKSHKLRTVPVNSGIGRDAIVSDVKKRDNVRKIISVSPAIFNDKTVWIASYLNSRKRPCYQTFNYYTGKSIQLITNV